MNKWLPIWGAVGPLVGVLVGAFLSVAGQRRQWLLDRKREEYRQLLDGISEATHKVVHEERGRKLLEPIGETVKLSVRTVSFLIADRIFILTDAMRLDFLERWDKATDALLKHDLEEFIELAVNIQADLRSVARKALGIAPMLHLRG